MGEVDLTNMTLGRPYLQVRQAIFEWIGGWEKEGNLLLAEAMENGNEGGRLSYFAYLISKTYEAPLPFISQLENAVKTIFAAATPAGAAALTDVFKYVRLIVPGKWWLDKESKRLNACALKAADQPCTPGMRKRSFVTPLMSNGRTRSSSTDTLTRCSNWTQSHPSFSTSSICTAKARIFFSVLPRKKDLERLRDIQAIAVERNERLLINLLGKEIRQIEEFPVIIYG